MVILSAFPAFKQGFFEILHNLSDPESYDKPGWNGASNPDSADSDD
jgi:hypothetical protein